MLNRMVGAALFRADTYEEIEADVTAMGQAFAIVLLVTICGIVGGILNEVVSPPTVTVQTATGETVEGQIATGEPVIGETATVESFTLIGEPVEGEIVAVETITALGVSLAVVGGLFFGIARWAMWVTLLLIVGGSMMRSDSTQTSWSELGRVVGFAYLPGVLSLLGFVPGFGGLLPVAGFFWTLALVVVAVRHALDYDSVGRAIVVVLITGVLGFIPWIIIKIIEWVVT